MFGKMEGRRNESERKRDMREAGVKWSMEIYVKTLNMAYEQQSEYHKKEKRKKVKVLESIKI